MTLKIELIVQRSSKKGPRRLSSVNNRDELKENVTGQAAPATRQTAPGVRSEHHALDVRVGQVERRQTAATNRDASAFHDVLRVGCARSRPRHSAIARVWPQHKDVPSMEVT